MRVIEEFISIDGEGPTAGALAYFIRFYGCNLRCSWCDTAYSWDESLQGTEKSVAELVEAVRNSGVRNVTLTGGEPLLQSELGLLLDGLLTIPNVTVHIETNGAVSILPFLEQGNHSRVEFILDYKLPDSGMESAMIMENLTAVRERDSYKFVIASEHDLLRAVEIVREYRLDNRCQVFFSPVWGKMQPADIVERMKAEQLHKIRLQLQLHKMIWPMDMRGV